MAEIFPDMAGAISGKVGGASYYVTEDGRNLVRGRRKRATKRRKRVTEDNREFGALSDLGSRMRRVVRVGFPERPRGWSAWNVFMSRNRGVAQMDERGRVEVDVERLVCAWGHLREPRAEAELLDDGARFSWRGEGDSFAGRSDDTVWGVMLGRLGGYWHGFVKELGRRGEGGEGEIRLGEPFDETHAYAFARSADGRRASPSVFLG